MRDVPTVNELLRRLVTRGLLYRPTRGSYQFALPLFGGYLRRHRKITEIRSCDFRPTQATSQTEPALMASVQPRRSQTPSASDVGQTQAPIPTRVAGNWIVEILGGSIRIQRQRSASRMSADVSRSADPVPTAW